MVLFSLLLEVLKDLLHVGFSFLGYLLGGLNTLLDVLSDLLVSLLHGGFSLLGDLLGKFLEESLKTTLLSLLGGLLLVRDGLLVVLSDLGVLFGKLHVPLSSFLENCMGTSELFNLLHVLGFESLFASLMGCLDGLSMVLSELEVLLGKFLVEFHGLSVFHVEFL